MQPESDTAFDLESRISNLELFEICPDSIPETCDRSECIVDGTGFVSAVNHAVRAARIAGLRSIPVPVGLFQKLGERFEISVLKQVTWFLPAKQTVAGHAPRRARICAQSHQVLQEQRALVELPRPFAIAQDRGE